MSGSRVIWVKWTGLHDIYMTLESCREALLQKITDVRILFRDLRWSWSPVLPLFVEAVRVSAIERKIKFFFLELSSN